MPKPTKLDVSYVAIHCRRLAAALLSVGVDFAKDVPPACRVVSDGGQKIEPPEETYHFQLRTRDKTTQTKSLIETWEDVSKMGDEGHVDAVDYTNKTIAELRAKLTGNAEALRLLNRIETLLPCLAVAFMRTFAINYGSFCKTQGKILSYDRTYQRADRRKIRKKQLERERAKIDAELKDLSRQLADKPPKFYFPRLRLSQQDNHNERTA